CCSAVLQEDRGGDCTRRRGGVEETERIGQDIDPAERGEEGAELRGGQRRRRRRHKVLDRISRDRGSLGSRGGQAQHKTSPQGESVRELVHFERSSRVDLGGSFGGLTSR